LFSFATLLERMQERGETPALIEVAGETLLRVSSFARIAGRARALARNLIEAGLAPGDPVALWAENSAAWVETRLAIAAAGGVTVAIDDLADAEEAAAILRSSGARRLFTVSAHLPKLPAEGSPERPRVMLIDADPVNHPPAGDGAALPALSGDAPAMLVYTSGTTGRPKAFSLRNRHIEANVRAMGGFGLIGDGDRLLLPLPLHHVYPFVVGLLTPLSVGATIVLPEAATGPKIVRALNLAGVTTMIGVPRLYEAIVAGLEGQAKGRGRLVGALFTNLLALSVAIRRRFGVRLGRLLFRRVHARLGGRLRLLISAGAKLAPEYVWKLEGLGFIALSGYGLAETASAFTGNVPGAQRIGSEGRPLLADGRIRIVEPDATGTGEIQLKGASIFDGYIDDDDANRAAFTEDGWFRTGDLGSVDADGFIVVSGRLKELIVLGGGKNVFPEELEKHYGADPVLREVAVLERQGALVAVVLPDLEAIRKSANTAVEDVVRVALASAAKSLPSHERLSGFAIVRQPLPRTRLGKYQRFLLPKLYEDARAGGAPAAKPLSDEDRALLQRPAAAAAWKVLQDRYAARGLSLDADPQLDLGIDSLEWLSLGLELESAAGVALAEQDFADVAQVRDLLRLVEARAAAPAAVTDRSASLAEDEAYWLAPTTPAETVAGTGLYHLNRLLARLFFRLRADGLEHLPAPPFVLVANHVSDLDPPLLGAALPLPVMRRLYWSADRGRLFGSALSRAFCRVSHVFPVDERAPGSTLAMAERALARGHALIWFPESWRSPDGELQRFLPGIGKLLSAQPVPAVPCHIRGSFEAMPRERAWPRPHPVHIVFGPPLDPAVLAARAEGDTAEARITEGLRRAVAALSHRS
jgi:long-chain acyl-CoA synthetase